MADPFDALRRRDGTSAPAPPDPDFRSALMAELERALTRDDSHLSPLVTGSEPVPLEVTVSSPISTSAPSGSPNRRFLAIGLAAAAVVALVLTGVLVTRDDDVEPVAALPVGTDSAVPTTTAAPTTTADPMTTAAPPATEPTVGNESETAEAVLLSASDYDPAWGEAPFKVAAFDAMVAEGLPSCAAYVDVVFEGPSRPAGVAYRWFFHADPSAVMLQYVVVLPDDAAAAAMFDATEDPAFVDGCLTDYIATFSNEYCCDVNVPYSPLTIEGKVDPPALTLPGDQSSVRGYEGFWIDEKGVSHGPEQWVSATIRVGRSVTVVEALVEGEGGVPMIGLDEFEQIVARIVDQAEVVLGS